MKKLFLHAILLLTTLSLQAQPVGDNLKVWIAEAQARAPAPLLSRGALKLTDPVRVATLAPDGSKVSYLVKDGATRHLLLQDSGSGHIETLMTDDRLQQLQWTADSQALLLSMKGVIALLPLSAGSQARYLYKLDGTHKQRMVGTTASPQPQLLIASTENGREQLILVDSNGIKKALYEGDGLIEHAVADADAHHVFLEVKTSMAIRILAIEAQGPRVLLQCKVYETCQVDAYDAANSQLWVRQAHDSDLLSLYRIELPGGRISKVHQDPEELSSLQQVCYAGNQPQIAHYVDRGWRAEPVRADYKSLLASLHRRLAGSGFLVSDCGDKVWLLRESSSRLSQARYHLFDLHTQTLRFLYGGEEKIAPRQLVDRHFIQYPASDGMMINGYVSLPDGVPLAQAPLVTLVHGGPFLHVDPDYYDLVQLMANRGYIVFEPNFRGSAGFGQRYMLASHKDFGNGRVQQDILDGLDWLLAQGLGARDKQAIVGGSFGGFAALTALAYTPARFQAGIAMVPPADLGETIRLSAEGPDSQDPSWAEFMRQLLLNTDDPAEVAALYQRSPMAALSAIQAPLLIVAGGADHNVDIRHVRQFSSRLLGERKPVSLLIDEREGHGFVGEDATSAQMYLLESFLATRLHGRVEPLQDAMLKQYLQRKLLVNQTPGFEPMP